VVDDAGHEREIRVPDYVPSGGGRTHPILSSIGKLDDLSRIRAKELEQIQGKLLSWISDRGGIPVEWSEPKQAPESSSSVASSGRKAAWSMEDTLQGYAAWRSARKMHRLLSAWSRSRTPGDREIYDSLMAWARQDRHLETWQACQRERMIAHRREAYRVVAADLARRYATIVVGKGRLVDIEGWDRPEPEDGDPSDGKVQRRMARICAPGELLEEVHRAAGKTGAQVRKANDVKATQICALCGCDKPWDARPQIMHLCMGCGRQQDQDANYCRNLLIREGFIQPPETRYGSCGT
jgi:hypothetical protein